jgi:hypothetical protein
MNLRSPFSLLLCSLLLITAAPAAVIIYKTAAGTSGNLVETVKADATRTIDFANTALRLRDTNASHQLIIAPGSDLTANRTLTFTTGDADRTLTLSGNPTLGDWFDQSVKTTASPTFAGLALTGPLTVANGGTGRATSTTAYGLIAAGTTATGPLQTLAAGATTEILVGGGGAALPVWTTATGTGAPVRANTPTLVTPALGTPSSGTLTNTTGFPAANLAGTALPAAVVTSSLTTVGALGAGSITSSFGAIDIGSDSLTAGVINASGSIQAKATPSAAWGFDAAAGSAIAITASGNYDLAVGSGIVVVHNDNTGEASLFLLWAGNVTKIGGASSVVSGAPGASQIGLQWTGSLYRVTNGYATTQNVFLTLIRTRNSY